jgi:hypothetical protein
MFDLIRDGVLWGSKSAANKKILGQRRSLDRTKETQRELEVRFERLKLVTLAMWDLIKSTEGVTDADLYRAIRNLDLADGRADRKLDDKSKLLDCANCSRVLLSSAVVCPYCGSENDEYDPVADL